MTESRYKELNDFDSDAELTYQEIFEGWHFCAECDFLLTNDCCLDRKDILDDSEILF